MRTAIRKKTSSGMERNGIGVEVYCGARHNPWYPRHCKHACSRPPVICVFFLLRNFVCRTCVHCLPAPGEITVLYSELYALQADKTKCLLLYLSGYSIISEIKFLIWKKYCISCAINVQATDQMEGYAVAQLFEALRYKPEGRGVRFPMESLNFSVT